VQPLDLNVLPARPVSADRETTGTDAVTKF